jgi:hypothetical protein
MNTALQILHWLAGFVVLAEALNKLERTAPFARGMLPHDRMVDGLKALAWALLALGGGGAVATPFLGALGVHASASQMVLHQAPSFAETAVLLGFAVLIIRTRVKEG